MLWQKISLLTELQNESSDVWFYALKCQYLDDAVTFDDPIVCFWRALFDAHSNSRALFDTHSHSRGVYRHIGLWCIWPHWFSRGVYIGTLVFWRCISQHWFSRGVYCHIGFPEVYNTLYIGTYWFVVFSNWRDVEAAKASMGLPPVSAGLQSKQSNQKQQVLAHCLTRHSKI